MAVTSDPKGLASATVPSDQCSQTTSLHLLRRLPHSSMVFRLSTRLRRARIQVALLSLIRPMEKPFVGP